jgi:plastocyanin
MLLRPRTTHSRSSSVLRSVTPLLGLAGSAVLLVACGSSSGSSGAPTGANAPAPATSSASGATVTATETEFKIALSQTSLKPGSYTFQARNAGTFPHALTVDGPGVADRATPKLSPGQTGSVTVALQPGTYTVYCPVDGHRAKGMLTHVTVAAGTAPTSSPASAASTSGGGGAY